MSFPYVLLQLIVKYMVNPRMKLIEGGAGR